MGIRKVQFGTTRNGKAIDLYTLINAKGMAAQIINYGATLVSLKVPQQNGGIIDVTLGYDSLNAYEQDTVYFGGTIGRYANRIADGIFSLHGKRYHLTKNKRTNHLHGGNQGFNKVVWDVKALIDDADPMITLTYISKDGEEGYPANLSATVAYTLTDENEMRIDYIAETDQTTVINLSHHSYFNLAGAGSGDILDHILMIHADQFTPVNSRLIPTGELRSVKDTPLDFLKPREIGARIEENDDQLNLGKGYDHNWVLNKKEGVLAPAAKVTEPKSGRTMEVYTTQPGIQFYTGNLLGNRIAGKDKQVYGYRSGFCLETQHFPDTPNRPEFPPVVLEPGEKYKQTTIYRFSIS
jgi:aldose 1-epimerase